jgi:hypothetical protein
MNQDVEHVQLLSTFHYVAGGLMAFFACIPIIHVTLGMAMLLAPDFFNHGHDAPPAFLGLFFVAIGGAFMLVGWTLAVLAILAGRFLAQRRRHTFCFVVACVLCAWMPFGTVLGVFTIIVLSRPSVKILFRPLSPHGRA